MNLRVLIESIKRDCSDEVIGVLSVMEYFSGIIDTPEDEKQ